MAAGNEAPSTSQETCTTSQEAAGNEATCIMSQEVPTNEEAPPSHGAARDEAKEVPTSLETGESMRADRNVSPKAKRDQRGLPACAIEMACPREVPLV
jgi:hypothetical protein